MEFGLFYDLPVWGVFLLFAVINLVALETGYRYGLTQKKQWAEAESGSGDIVLSSMLALLALILAFSIAAGVNRSENRKAAVLAEANALTTAFLHADLLREPGRAELRDAVLAYAKTRIIDGPLSTMAEREAFVERSLAVQSRLWPLVEGLVDDGSVPDVFVPPMIRSIDELLDEHTARLAAYSDKLPSAVVWLLVLVAGGSLTIAGFNAGLRGKMSRWRMNLFAIVLSSAMYMVIDLDRPNDGLVTVPQWSIIWALAEMDAAVKKTE